VEAHLDDPRVRILESNEDPLVYPSGHLPGAAELDWQRDLNDPLRRDYIEAEQFSQLAGRLGITPETTVVLYGDHHNWWAAYCYWVFQLFGHQNSRLLDGGRQKWELDGRAFTQEVPELEVSDYPVPRRQDEGVRVLRDGVLAHVKAGLPLVDVREPAEFRGERLHMMDYPNEGALRGGHIPGARNIPWDRAVNQDGTFKNAEQLRDIYATEHGLVEDDDIITYCRIGERSSHTWFLLTRLLGYRRVRNYDGSWTEWGNLVGAPVAR
jgi:thiosulfate/3-mercaptopyruvate sulfurtransferase